jgi:hypothetical protein
MRKFYLNIFNCLQKRTLQVLGLTSLALTLNSSMFAQSTWTGTSSSNVLTTDNWNPAIALTNTGTGVNLIIPRTPIKAGNLLYEHPPILSGAQNITVRSCIPAVAPTTVTSTDSVDTNGDGIKDSWVTGGRFIVNLDPGYTFTLENGSSATTTAYVYMTGFDIKSGTMKSTRGMRSDNDSVINIVENNGILNLAVEMVMGKDGGAFTSSVGGRLILRGNGKLISASWQGRCTPKKKGPQIYISENATAEFTGKINFTPHIRDSNKIVGGAGYYPVTKIDVANNKTYIWAVPDNQLLIGQTDPQIITAGDTGRMMSVVLNQAWKDCNPASFEWKYSLTSGGPYLSFSTPVLNDTIKKHIFDVSGTLYVVCTAAKTLDGSSVTSNEVKFIIGSGKLKFTPAGTQYLRVGQIGAPITVAETGTSTAREWKYSTVSQGPYSSFATPETGITYTPNFADNDTFYVQLQSTIDGVVEKSKEIQIFYDKWTAGARPIAWLGTSSDITNAVNWNPIAYVHRNSLTIPTGVSYMPIHTSAGMDTINFITINAGASYTVNKPAISDTLTVRTDNQSQGGGKLLVKSGAVHFLAGLRLTANTDTLDVRGTGSVLFKGGLGLANGNAATPTTGGKVIISENGLIKHDVGPYRMPATTASTFGCTIIKGNGQAWYLGNQISNVVTWTKTKKLLSDTLTSNRLTFIYDSVSNYTRVWSFDTAQFCVMPRIRQYVGRNQVVTFTAANTAGLSNLQWLYRKNVKDGKNINNTDAWTAISGANGTSVDVSFPTTGDYFVICVGVDGSLNTQRTLNFGRVVVTAIDVTPAAEQTVAIDANINRLDRMPRKTKGEWLYSTTLGSGYASFPTAVTDTFLVKDFTDLGIGTYYVIYQTTTPNDEAVPVSVYSNVVTINVTDVTGVVNKQVEPSVVYPNPTNGNFKVNSGNAGAFTLQIVDMNGKVVYTKDYNYNSGDVPVTYNKKGVYVVKVISGKDVKVSRLIVK